MPIPRISYQVLSEPKNLEPPEGKPLTVHACKVV